MEKIIRVYAKELKRETGETYLVFSYTKDGQKFYDVKFRLSCLIRPNEKGYWLVKVDTLNTSIQKNKDKKNDIIWFSKVLDAVKDASYEQSIKEKQLKEIEELF